MDPHFKLKWCCSNEKKTSAKTLLESKAIKHLSTQHSSDTKAIKHLSTQHSSEAAQLEPEKETPISAFNGVTL